MTILRTGYFEVEMQFQIVYHKGVSVGTQIEFFALFSAGPGTHKRRLTMYRIEQISFVENHEFG